MAFGEVAQRHGGGDVEIGRSVFCWCAPRCFGIHQLDDRQQPIHQAHEIFFGAGLAVDRQSLLDPLQVGRGKNAGAQAGGFEDRADHRRRRALAFGARDMNHPEALLRIAQPGQEFDHPFELEFAGAVGDGERPFVVDPVVEELQRGLAP